MSSIRTRFRLAIVSATVGLLGFVAGYCTSPRDWLISASKRPIAEVFSISHPKDTAGLTRIAQFDSRGFKLGQAVEFLRQSSGVDVFVDWHSLTPFITEETPLNGEVRLRDVTLKTALIEVFRCTRGRIDFRDADNMMIIEANLTGPAPAPVNPPRIYDVRDLLANPGAWSSAGGQDSVVESPHRQSARNRLSGLIHDTLPSQYDESADYFKCSENYLLASVSPQRQIEIENLLTVLRDIMAKHTAPKSELNTAK